MDETQDHTQKNDDVPKATSESLDAKLDSICKRLDSLHHELIRRAEFRSSTL